VEKTRGPSTPENGYVLNSLGMAQQELGLYSEAESNFQRALAIWEGSFGSEYAELATSPE